MKLTKLQNGNWIDLSTVRAIRPLPSSSAKFGGTHSARVCIDHGENGIEIVTANDDEHASQLADEYAQLVNALK